MNKRLPYKTAKRVQSSAVNVINYSHDKKILEVEFVNENVYWYKEVPEAIWKKLLIVIEEGNSAGEFINKEIKPNFSFEQIE